MSVKQVPFENIDPNPWQTRLVEDPEHVAALVDSIKQDGLLQIPTARPLTGDRYQLAFGHSRLAACRQLHAQGLFSPNFPLNVQELTDEELFRAAVTENNARKELTAIEIARAMQIYRDDFGKSSHEIGQLFQLSASAVRNKIRLLGLPEETQDQIERGALTESAGRSLLQLQRLDPEKVSEVTRSVAEDGLTSDDVLQNTSDLIRNSPHTVIMHTSWADPPPRAGDDLWLLREWIPDLDDPDGVFNVVMFARLMTAVREEKIEVADTKTAPAYWDKFTLQTFEDLVADYFNHPDHWQELHAGYGRRFLEVFQALVDQQHTCSACPFYLQSAGSHYCGVKPCWDWRRDRYLAEHGAQLSASLGGIQIYKKEDGKSARVSDYSGWKHEEQAARAVAALFETWLAARDPRLRLKLYSHSYRAHEATGSNWYDLVCVGDAVAEVQEAYDQAAKKHHKKKKQKEPTGPSQWEMESARDDASKEFLKAEAVPVFRALLACIHPDLLAWYYADYASPPAQNHMLDDFTFKVLFEGLSYTHRKQGPLVISDLLAGLAKACGLDYPKDWAERAAAYEPKFDDQEGSDGE